MNSLTQKASTDDDGLDLKTHLYLLFDNRRLITCITVLFTLLGIAYGFSIKPTYETNILIQVEDKSSKNPLGDASSLFDNKTAATSEMEILRSRMVVSRAVDNLQLYTYAVPKYFPFFGVWLATHNRQLSEPGLFGRGGYVWGDEEITVSLFKVPPSLLNYDFTLKALENGQYLLNADRFGMLLKGKIGIKYLVPTEDGNVELKVDKLHSKPGGQFMLHASSRLSAIERLQDSLLISEKGKQSGLIGITLSGTNPTVISNTLNEIGREYVRQNFEQKSAETQQSLVFLDKQLTDLKRQLDKSETALQQFRHAHSTIDLAEESKQLLQRSLNAQTKLSDLKQRREELLIRFTTEHPIVVGVDKEMAEINGELKSIDTQIRGMPLLEQQILHLTREVKLNTDLYTLLLNSEQQLSLFKAGKVSNVRVVDAAVVPERPVKSNRSMMVIIAFLLGLSSGIAVAFVRKMLFGGINDGHEIEHVLGLTISAGITHSKQQELLYQQCISALPKLSILAHSAPSDMAIEQLRSFRTTLLLPLQSATNNIVLIAGPTSNVGKTFVSVNFAVVLAAAGKKVVVIDADLRNGCLHQYFGLERQSSPGLSEAISGNSDLVQAIHRGLLENVDFIATGALPLNPSELLWHDNTGKLLKSLSASYDYVLIAAPPVLAVSDALILGAHAATTYLILRAGRSTLKDIKESLKRLSGAGIGMTGIIFNGIKKRRLSPWQGIAALR